MVRKERKKPKLSRRILFMLTKIVLIFIALSVGVIFSLRYVPPPTSSLMIQQRLKMYLSGKKDPRLHYRWVDWRKIPPSMAIAVVAAEDQEFPHHRGFDFESIRDAVEEYEQGRGLRGASTISQQTAKNLFLWPERSYLRKGLEAYLTLLMELLWPKRRILEVYLNIAEFGEGVFGVAAASETFFSKPPQNLGPEESALLAAVLPNPLRFKVQSPSKYVRKRAAWIQDQARMLDGPAYLKNL